MSLILTDSGNISCKTMPNFDTGAGFFKNKFYIGDYEININDFNELILYYLTNTDLEVGDKRLELLEKIKKLHQVDGWNKENKRLNRTQSKRNRCKIFKRRKENCKSK